MSPWFPPGVESESVPCDHCGGIEEQMLFEGPDRLHHLPGTFRVVECLRCGTIRQNPRPTAETIGYYYPPDYISFVRAVEDEPRPWNRWDRRYELLKRRRAVERLQPKGRLLDVGCSTGVFLHEMQRAGWDVVGIEPSAYASEYAQRRFDLQVHVGTLQEAGLPSAAFDVITLWDVLEHLHSPWRDLQLLHCALKAGGLLVVQFPNLESLDARWFGPRWIGWDLPRHLYFFPYRLLASALCELGLVVEGSRCIAGSQSAFLLSLRIHFTDRHHQAMHWPDLVLRVGHTMASRLLLAPFFWIVSKVHLSSVVTLFARKRSGSETQV